MNRIQRCLAVLAGLGGTLIAITAAAPAAFASLPPHGPALTSSQLQLSAWFGHPPLPPGHIHQPVHQPPVPVPIHTLVSGGMAGWRITLIAAMAAPLTAVLAVLADRAQAARRRATTTA
jgi:hypothetical protein